MTNDQFEYELVRLWLLANEGLASEEELGRLNSWLEQDANARKSLFHLTRHQSWLIWNGTTAPGLARAALLKNLPAEGAAAAGSPTGVPLSAELQPQRRTSANPLRAVIERSAATLANLQAVRVPLVSYRMAALAASVAVVAGWFALNYEGVPGGNSVSAASNVRAEMVGATVCVWSGGHDGTPVLGHQFHDGEALQLLEGVAELKIDSATSAAELQLEGPVALVIGSNGISNLRFGKVAIQTSPVGNGFQVATSFGRVVAGPGAEFGISTFGNSAEVHVFEGSVAIESPWIVSDDGEFVVRHINQNEAVRLSQAGEASLQVSNIPADRGLFTTRLSMDSNFLPVKQNYVRAIRDAKPVAYWRFESASGNHVRNEMSDRFQGELRGDFRWVGPSNNQALELGVAPNPGAMRVTDSWDDVLTDKFSFEFWMRPSHYHVGTILGFAGPFDWTVKKNTYGMAIETQGGWGDGERTNRVRFLNRAPLAMYTPGMSLYSQQRYAARHWQHVVAVRKGSALKLYLDGELVQAGRAAGPTPKGLQLVVGQLYTDALERPFIGYLDELAIYDRALSEQEVQEHYRLIRSDAKPHESI